MARFKYKRCGSVENPKCTDFIKLGDGTEICAVCKYKKNWNPQVWEYTLLNTKKIIDLSGKLDWHWRKGNLDIVKETIKQIRHHLSLVERELPNKV